MSDWGEIVDHNQECSYSNGWCGMCGRCCEHAQDLHEQESWGDEE